MRKILFFFFAALLPVILYAQEEGEPKQCPWGCPTIQMRNSTSYLTNQTKTLLNDIALKMKSHSDCNVTIFTYPDSTKAYKLISAKRMDAIKNYLVEKGIAAGRIANINEIQGGNKNNIDIKSDCDLSSGTSTTTRQCPCDYPGFLFKGSEVVLDSTAKAVLSAVVTKLKSNPECNILVATYPEANKSAQAMGSRRLDIIKRFLVEKEGISADRIVTNEEIGGGEKNTIDIKCD